MRSFDPDTFAVVGEDPMTRMALPGKKYAECGLVREVYLDPEDLPYRMVCFTCRDLGTVVGVNPARFHAYIRAWGWPTPVYQSKQAWQKAAAKGLSWSHVRVYTYPEAEVILDTCKKCPVTTKWMFGSLAAPDAAREVTAKITAIRQAMEN